MPKHTAEIFWQRRDALFTDSRYSRTHRWRFDGGVDVPASSSPESVRIPFSDPAGVDPEEAFVASLSSCHMLWFLAIAARHRFVIDSYCDSAEGFLENDAEGRPAMTRVILRPNIVFSGPNVPDDADIAALHDEAHDKCFLANSVKTIVTVEPSGSRT